MILWLGELQFEQITGANYEPSKWGVGGGGGGGWVDAAGFATRKSNWDLQVFPLQFVWIIYAYRYGILFLYPFFSSCIIQGGFCLTELKSFLVKNDFSRHLDIKSWIIFEKGVSK